MKTETFDCCVIGSGPGGAVIALRLAEAGKSTIVLERGPRVEAAELTFQEMEMIPRLYKDGGLQQNSTLDMFILQGSCLGGSAFLSNMVMLRPDDAVLSKWQNLGADFDLNEITGGFSAIEERLGVTRVRSSNVSGSTHRVMEAARVAGRRVQTMTKALGDCTGCGYCNSGCPFDFKQSPIHTHLQPAERLGAVIRANTSADRLIHRGGRVQAAHCRNVLTGEETQVQADTYVVSGGAVNSSGLLLNSGIRKNVGRGLSFNLAVMLTAEFDDDLCGFDGDQMTMYYAGDGYIIEPTHNPPMGAALTTPGWFESHGELMRKQRKLAYCGVLAESDASGRVVHSRIFGHEETRFQLSAGDRARIRAGLRDAAEVLLEAGARRVLLPTHELVEVRNREQLGRIDEIVSQRRRLLFGSAHPMGGNAWSDDASRGVVDKDLAVHGFENLHVVDASVFPSCIGVNPIETIMAVSEYGAQRILERI